MLFFLIKIHFEIKKVIIFIFLMKIFKDINTIFVTT